MVLMLRSQGIPARLVTGFLGGEYNPFEGYLILRALFDSAEVADLARLLGFWMIHGKPHLQPKAQAATAS